MLQQRCAGTDAYLWIYGPTIRDGAIKERYTRPMRLVWQFTEVSHVRVPLPWSFYGLPKDMEGEPPGFILRPVLHPDAFWETCPLPPEALIRQVSWEVLYAGTITAAARRWLGTSQPITSQDVLDGVSSRGGASSATRKDG